MSHVHILHDDSFCCFIHVVFHTCGGGENSGGVTVPYPPTFVWLGMLRISSDSGIGASGASYGVNRELAIFTQSACMYVYMYVYIP